MQAVWKTHYLGIVLTKLEDPRAPLFAAHSASDYDLEPHWPDVKSKSARFDKVSGIAEVNSPRGP